MNFERRRLFGRKVTPALVAVPVALLVGLGCLQLLDGNGDSADVETVARRAAPRAALPRRAAALTPTLALVPAAPPEQVSEAGPGVDMPFKDWKQKRITRQEWEQKQLEQAIHKARQKARPAWTSKNVFALSKELQELDRLSAQRLLASRFGETEPNSPQRVGLHKVDYQLGLDAWKLHIGGVKPVLAWANQKTEPRHSLEPNQVRAFARHKRRRAKRERQQRQALAQ
ncbi:MAG: hypothetical protein JKY65_34210 [Planctomycetes bacterium]|nr:hypothetical protein [Planctomycetota bacterium]